MASASRGISHSCQCLLERSVQLLAQRLQLRLPLLPDDIDLGVVGDGLERDVRHALVDEAVADVAVHGLRTRRGAGDFGFLELAFAGIGQQVERIARAHDAGAGQRQRHARGVDRDPAAAPLLGDVAVVPEPQVGSSTRSPGSVAIRMQRSTTSVDCLNDVDFSVAETAVTRVVPDVVDRIARKVVDDSAR